VIIGPNGAGKTSLLRIAAAAEHPSSGVAYVLGERLGRVDMSELRARIGLSSSALSQRIPGDELVSDLVVSAGYAVLGRWRERYDDVDYRRAVDMLESVGAEHLAERTYGTLSEGERKRVLIARSLMTDPELLLLDEPAAALDLGGREELVARLTDLAADPDAPALVLVTHHAVSYTHLYHALRASNRIAIERGSRFGGFAKSKYASGEFFDKYTEQVWEPATARVAELFAEAGIRIPTQEDWQRLKDSVQQHGIYNQNLQAVPPTGSISYINHSTSSIHPVASKIEIRKEGKIGRAYYPAPYLTNDNLEYYQDAYEIGYEKIIDTYAAATQHVDQGLSLTLFFKDTATTRDVNRAQIYAWRKGIKTLYYIRLRQMALEGTEVEGCVSCML